MNERFQARFDGKTPAEVHAEGLVAETPAQYTIPETKRIQEYKERFTA